LGSYQAGVYEALASSEYLPDWVAGISIGAINAAIIVGNTPQKPREALAQFLGRGHRPTQFFAVCISWLTGRLVTKVKCADSIDVWSARVFHPTPTERLAFTRQSRQLLRHLRPQGHA
jgi:predicted acylesterase/phospholipase RssA